MVLTECTRRVLYTSEALAVNPRGMFTVQLGGATSRCRKHKDMEISRRGHPPSAKEQSRDFVPEGPRKRRDSISIATRPIPEERVTVTGSLGTFCVRERSDGFKVGLVEPLETASLYFWADNRPRLSNCWILFATDSQISPESQISHDLKDDTTSLSENTSLNYLFHGTEDLGDH